MMERLGPKTETKLTIRTLSAKTWTYTYTDDGQLKEVVNPDSETTLHEYLTDSRLKKITLRKTGGGSGPTREYFYVDTNDSHVYVSAKPKFLRKTLDKTSGASTISSASYELDKAGRQLSDTDQASRYRSYGLDPNSNTRAENMWTTKTSSTREYQFLYDFDSNGNRTSKFEDGTRTTYTYGDSNEMLTAGSDTFTYDHFLNMKTKVSGGSTTTYNWDFESNLLSIDFPSTANDDTHEYDAVGRRMRSKLGGASNWTHFVWDEVESQLLAEYTLITSTFTLVAENTWGLGLISSNRSGTKRYFHFDGVGNAVALTDTSQTITDTYGYTESGQTVSSLDSGTSVNPFRWQGMSGAYDDGAMGSLGRIVLLRGKQYDLTLLVELNGNQKKRPMQNPNLAHNDCSKLGATAVGICIAALCSMLATKGMADMVKFIGKGLEEIVRDIVKGWPQNGGSIPIGNSGPEGCCKEASGNGIANFYPSLEHAIIGAFCRKVAPGQTPCYLTMRTERGCYRCCEIKFPPSSVHHGLCKRQCDYRWQP